MRDELNKAQVLRKHNAYLESTNMVDSNMETENCSLNNKKEDIMLWKVNPGFSQAEWLMKV